MHWWKTRSLRGAYFPGVNFSAAGNSIFGSPAGRDSVFNPLLDRMLGVRSAVSRIAALVRTELDTLTGHKLLACGAGCDAERTKTITKASCAAVIGSAVTLLQ